MNARTIALSVAVLSIGTTCVAADITTGLIHHYQFEASAEDSAGNSDGTEHGTITYVDGPVGLAAVFDGGSGEIGDYISVPNPWILNDTPGFTIAFWIKTQDTSSYTLHSYAPDTGQPDNESESMIVACGATSNPPIIPPDTLGLWLYHSGSAPSPIVHATHPILDGVWHHVAFVRSLGTIDAYLDGVNVITGSITRADTTPTKSSIGRTADPSYSLETSWFEGSLDDLRFYNRALTGGDVLELATEDCNNNGIPDECDLDCAATIGTTGGLCSVLFPNPACGQSTDGNGDGIPDECGACCGDIQCLQVPQTACESLGTYEGDGTTCDAVACNFIPAVSTWGLVVMVILMLSAATLVVTRRRSVVA